MLDILTNEEIEAVRRITREGRLNRLNVKFIHGGFRNRCGTHPQAIYDGYLAANEQIEEIYKRAARRYDAQAKTG